VWNQVRREPGGVESGLRHSSRRQQGASTGADRQLRRPGEGCAQRGAACQAPDHHPASWAPPLRARALLVACTPRCGTPAPISSPGSRPDPIHTVAPRGDEHTKPSTPTVRLVRAITRLARLWNGLRPIAGPAVGSVGREQSHHLRCRVALRDARARDVPDRRRASFWCGDSHGVLRCPRTAGQRDHGVARRASCRRAAGNSRAARLGRATAVVRGWVAPRRSQAEALIARC
jgi:hypothetical protein